MHHIRRSCQSSFFRHWHFKCTLISASAQPPWSWLSVLLFRSSNLIVMKGSSTGAEGSGYCKWACSFFSNSGIDRICTKLYSIYSACLSTKSNPRIISCPGLVSFRSLFSVSLSSVFKLWDVRWFLQIGVYFTPFWNIIDIDEQMQASTEWRSVTRPNILPRCLFNLSSCPYFWWPKLAFNFSTCQF